jgi:hypothetical protein
MGRLLFGTPVQDDRQDGSRCGVSIVLPTRYVCYQRDDNGHIALRRLCHPAQLRVEQATVTAVTIHILGTTFPERVANMCHGRASSAVAGAVEVAA